MVKAVDEICANCGKAQPKKGSLTQWIGLTDSCRCALLDAPRKSEAGGENASSEGQESAESKDALCQECGKHLKRNTGSLTQWVFRQDTCTCADKSAQSDDSSQADGATQIPGDQVTKTPGQVIARHYEVISCLGEGGTSVVYKARHQYMERVAAIKVLSPDRIPDAKTVQRFQLEARSVSRLKHPNIVDVLEFGVDENKQPYLIMDYLEGISLFEAVEKDGPMKPSRAAALFLQMADALKHAHEKGVIHRDLKPTNAILVKDENGHELVKLVDFGIAKLSEPEDKEKALTQTGEIFGSPFYMSPEQCKGLKLDHRSDIYSFGCLMYEMIIGEPAAKSGSVVETLMLHINGLTLDFDAQPVVKAYAEKAKESDSFENAHEQKCMTSLRQIIQGCIKKEPADRYQSMEDIRRDLERLLGGHKVFGGKESAFSWSGLGQSGINAKNTAAGKSFNEVVPLVIVVGGFAICIVGALLVYDPLQLLHKPKPAEDATSLPMPKTATHLMVATMANGNSDPIEKLSADTVASLEKDRVVTIRMRNTQVSDDDLRLLAQVRTLETIDITGSSGFTQDSIGALSKLPKLKTLVLAGTDVSDKSSQILQSMPIERLDLSYTRFTDAGIVKLLSSKTLRFIKPYKSLVTESTDNLLSKRGWKRAVRDWWEL